MQPSVIQSALDPHGPGAAVAAEITWVLFIGGAAIFVLVMALAAYAVFGRREGTARLDEKLLVVGGGIAFPAVVLATLLAYSLVRTGAVEPAGDAALRIEVVGEQWWWRVHYVHLDGRRDFATANEIRMPVGEPVELRLRSNDVIHSFWVPALAGKLDMIPGRTQRLRIRADGAGEFRGQCAEYCGGPHALMAFVVVAQERAAFDGWAAAQRADASAAGEGAQLFGAHCASCHTVRGTRANGTLGPDLTHVASRRTIGAGLLPNNPGTIAAWIASGQHLKPGNLMPSFAALPPAELAAIAAYVAELR